MIVNQQGKPVQEDFLGTWSDLSHAELQELLFLVIAHLNLAAYRTNATKHGTTELELRSCS